MTQCLQCRFCGWRFLKKATGGKMAIQLFQGKVSNAQRQFIQPGVPQVINWSPLRQVDDVWRDNAFTAPISGNYLVFARVAFTSNDLNSWRKLLLRVTPQGGGAQWFGLSLVQTHQNNNTSLTATGSQGLSLKRGDSVEILAQIAGPTPTDIGQSGDNFSNFSDLTVLFLGTEPEML
jgi:hypothetical protein